MSLWMETASEIGVKRRREGEARRHHAARLKVGRQRSQGSPSSQHPINPPHELLKPLLTPAGHQTSVGQMNTRLQLTVTTVAPTPPVALSNRITSRFSPQISSSAEREANGCDGQYHDEQAQLSAAPEAGRARFAYLTRISWGALSRPRRLAPS